MPTVGRRIRRPVLVVTVAALAVALLIPAGMVSAARPVADPEATADRQIVKVIVTFDGPPGAAAERAIKARGGKVRHKLGLVNGVAAELSRGQMKQLAKDKGVRRVEIDRP